MIRQTRITVSLLVLSVLAGSTILLGAEVRVPAFTAYLAPNVRGARVSAKVGITGWTGRDLKVLWYDQIKTPGKLSCAVQLRLD